MVLYVDGMPMLGKQIRECLVGKLLKIAPPFLTKQVDHGPGLVVELDALADSHSTNPLNLACRSSPAVVTPRCMLSAWSPRGPHAASTLKLAHRNVVSRSSTTCNAAATNCRDTAHESRSESDAAKPPRPPAARRASWCTEASASRTSSTSRGVERSRWSQARLCRARTARCTHREPSSAPQLCSDRSRRSQEGHVGSRRAEPDRR